jgi:hypothetical protein
MERRLLTGFKNGQLRRSENQMLICGTAAAYSVQDPYRLKTMREAGFLYLGDGKEVT